MRLRRYRRDQDVTKNRKKFDLRETILRKFLRDKHCPDQDFTEVFIAEADAHGLDWRLLPSLALVESGGGRNARGNNLFGWANGKRPSPVSERPSITVASYACARGGLSGQGSRRQTLHLNHGTDYPAMVLDIMRQISPRQQLEVHRIETDFGKPAFDNPAEPLYS